MESARGEDEALGPATQRDVARYVEVPIRERVRLASNPTSPVVRSMMPSKSACRSMIGGSGSGIAILNSPMMTIASGIREREDHAGSHRDERIRTAPAELQDRADDVLARPRGKTVATAESTSSARATRSSGISTSLAWPAWMRRRSDVVSTVRLSPKTPPTALSVRPGRSRSPA